MSMNSNNLEVKVNELTDVIKGLSKRPMLTSNDVNNLLENLTKRFENVNIEGFERLSDDVSGTVIDALDKKHKEVEERLKTFEEFVDAAGKSIQNPKMGNEITKILNDIEALYSKMNSQEAQSEALRKAFDSFKDFADTAKISKLSDEIVSISKSYDGIAEVLNNNFEEFLNKLEAQGSKEDIQRLSYYLETLESNQNVLVNAMNTITEKQDDIQNSILRTTSYKLPEKLDKLQGAIDDLNKLTASKSDIETVENKITSIMSLMADFKKGVDDIKDDSSRTLIHNRLNDIISKIDLIKNDSNASLSEDIIRLYTTVAEFKDNLFSTISNQFSDVQASFNNSFDKISNSMLNSNLDTNDAVNNLTSEIKKINSNINDNWSTKAGELKNEIRENIEAISKVNKDEVVNSIREEFRNIVKELSNLKSSDAVLQVARNIESLRNNLDFDSLALQMEEIKNFLNKQPVKEQFSKDNRDETLNNINDKVDTIIRTINQKITGNSATPGALSIQETPEIKEILDETKSVKNEISTLKNNISADAMYKLRDKVEVVEDIIKNFSTESINSRLDEIQKVILNANGDNIKELTDLLGEFDGNIKSNLDIIKAQILEVQSKQTKTDGIEAVVNGLEQRLHEKLTALAAIVQQSGGINPEALQKMLLSHLEAIKNEFKKGDLEVIEENIALKLEGMADYVKTRWGEVKDELIQNLRQEMEIITSLVNQRDESVQKDMLTKLAQVINAWGNSEARTNLIKDLTENLERVLNNTSILREISDEHGSMMSDVLQEIEVLSSKLNEKTSKDISEVLETLNGLRMNTDENNAKFVEIVSSIKEGFNKQDTKFALLVEKLKEVTDGSDTKAMGLINDLKTSFDNRTLKVFEALNILKEAIDKNSVSSFEGEMRSFINEEAIRIMGALNEIKENLVNNIEIANSDNDFKNSMTDVLNDIKDAFNNLNNDAKDRDTKILNAVESVRNYFTITDSNEQNDGKLRILDDIKETIKDSNSKLDDIFDKITEISSSQNSKLEDLLYEILNTVKDNNPNFDSSPIVENIDSMRNSIVVFQDKCTMAFDETNRNIEDTFNTINSNMEVMQSRTSDLLEQNKENLVNSFGQIQESMTNSIDLLKDVREKLAFIQDNSQLYSENTENSNRIENIIDSRSSATRSAITAAIEEKNADLINKAEEYSKDIQSCVNQTAKDIHSNFEQNIQNVHNNINQTAKDICNNVEQNTRDIHNNIDGTRDILKEIISNLELIQEKIGDNGSLNIKDMIDRIPQMFEENVQEIYNSVEDAKGVVSSIKQEITNNLSNDDMKNQLTSLIETSIKQQTSELQKEISNIGNIVLNLNKTEENEPTYTLNDVEHDIAKIRLDLQQANKLSNFKEFAARLVELRNINIENAKISRLIGSDVMRFDNSLKETAIRMDNLVKSIDKAEKARIEEVKARLLQNETNNDKTIPLKVEESLVSIYKKCKNNEMRLEDLANKIENLGKKNEDSFEIKELIDVFYDNTKKTKNLIKKVESLEEKMDIIQTSIEDKMDLIQAKIDHIITTCIDD